MAIVNIQDLDLRSVAVKDGAALKVVSTLKFPDATTQITAAGSSQWIASGANIYNANSGKVSIGSTAAGAVILKLNSAAAINVGVDLFINEARKAMLGINGAAGDFIIGSLADEFCFRAEGKAFNWSVDAGLSIAASLTTAPNLKIGGTATRATTEGTKHLDIFDGAAPVGTLANGISLYSTAGELRVMDAAGNATLLSPHDKEGRWIYHSKDTVTGRVLRVDMERLVRALNKKFGWDFVKEYKETA